MASGSSLTKRFKHCKREIETMKITSKTLEAKLAVIVSCKPEYDEWAINYSRDYGGYQITREQGSSIVMHRATAKEAYAFLQGVLEVVGY